MQLYVSNGTGHHPLPDPDAKIGFDVYKAIRHWDYVHRNGYGTHVVSPPIRHGKTTPGRSWTVPSPP